MRKTENPEEISKPLNQEAMLHNNRFTVYFHRLRTCENAAAGKKPDITSHQIVDMTSYDKEMWELSWSTQAHIMITNSPDIYNHMFH